MSRDDVRVGNVRLDTIDYHPHNVRVDLGDLRSLTTSIRRFGVLQPVVLEQRGQRLRIRAGHRRVAAARLAGLTRIPAVVHRDALEDDEWLVAAVHENTRRRSLARADRRRAVEAMRAEGITWQGIAEAFDVTPTAVQRWAQPSERLRAVGAAPSGGKPGTVRRSTIRTLAQEIQARTQAGTWTAHDVVDALLRFADSGTLSAALDHIAVPSERTAA